MAPSMPNSPSRAGDAFALLPGKDWKAVLKAAQAADALQPGPDPRLPAMHVPTSKGYLYLRAVWTALTPHERCKCLSFVDEGSRAVALACHRAWVHLVSKRRLLETLDATPQTFPLLCAVEFAPDPRDPEGPILGLMFGPALVFASDIWSTLQVASAGWGCRAAEVLPARQLPALFEPLPGSCTEFQGVLALLLEQRFLHLLGAVREGLGLTGPQAAPAARPATAPRPTQAQRPSKASQPAARAPSPTRGAEPPPAGADGEAAPSAQAPAKDPQPVAPAPPPAEGGVVLPGVGGADQVARPTEASEAPDAVGTSKQAAQAARRARRKARLKQERQERTAQAGAQGSQEEEEARAAQAARSADVEGEEAEGEGGAEAAEAAGADLAEAEGAAAAAAEEAAEGAAGAAAEAGVEGADQTEEAAEAAEAAAAPGDDAEEGAAEEGHGDFAGDVPEPDEVGGSGAREDGDSSSGSGDEEPAGSSGPRGAAEAPRPTLLRASRGQPCKLSNRFELLSSEVGGLPPKEAAKAEAAGRDRPQRFVVPRWQRRGRSRSAQPSGRQQRASSAPRQESGRVAGKATAAQPAHSGPQKASPRPSPDRGCGSSSTGTATREKSPTASTKSPDSTRSSTSNPRPRPRLQGAPLARLPSSWIPEPPAREELIGLGSQWHLVHAKVQNTFLNFATISPDLEPPEEHSAWRRRARSWDPTWRC